MVLQAVAQLGTVVGTSARVHLLVCAHFLGSAASVPEGAAQLVNSNVILDMVKVMKEKESNKTLVGAAGCSFCALTLLATDHGVHCILGNGGKRCRCGRQEEAQKYWSVFSLLGTC